jgi:hypothetical protein
VNWIRLGSVSLSIPEVAATVTFEHCSLLSLFLYGAWGGFLKEFAASRASPAPAIDLLVTEPIASFSTDSKHAYRSMRLPMVKRKSAAKVVL